MRWLFVQLVFCGLMGLVVCVDAQPASGAKLDSGAQSVLHTKWKTYYLPITDTIQVSFGARQHGCYDERRGGAFAVDLQAGKGCATLHDYAAENMCADLAGTYQVRIIDDTLILIMDEDPCDARGGTLMAKRWVRVAVPPAASPAVRPGKKNKKRG